MTRIQAFENVIFLFFLCFFVLPPLFANQAPVDTNLAVFKPSLQDCILYAIASIVLFVATHKIDNNDGKHNTKFFCTKKIFSLFAYSIIGFLLLVFIPKCLVFFAQNFFNAQFTSTASQAFNTPKITSAQNLCVLQFFSAKTFAIIISLCIHSIFEEFLYRLYLPKFLHDKILHQVKKRRGTCAQADTQARTQTREKIIFFAIELCVHLAFAFGHRYLGALNVLQSFLSSIVLRALFCKTKNIFATCTVHALYNIFVFAQLAL